MPLFIFDEISAREPPPPPPREIKTLPISAHACVYMYICIHIHTHTDRYIQACINYGIMLPAGVVKRIIIARVDRTIDTCSRANERARLILITIVIEFATLTYLISRNLSLSLSSLSLSLSCSLSCSLSFSLACSNARSAAVRARDA